jgi:hypothetical protein
MLAGKIERAALYDRALSAEEIAATASGATTFVSQADVLAALSEPQRQRLDQAKNTIKTRRAKLEALGDVPAAWGDQEAWTDLARAMFTFQEFIYVR